MTEIVLETARAFTAAELIAELRKVPDSTWVCVRGTGPVNSVVYEPGANEPFVVLESQIFGGRR